MTASRRALGLGLLGYGITTTVAFMAIGSPGGDYSDRMVTDYVAQGHWVTAFLWSYAGMAGAVCLFAFGLGARATWGRLGELIWGLAVAGAASSVAGWFVVGGVAVSMAEGGHAVQTGVAHPVVYTLTEIGNLLAFCSPAFFIGVAAVALAVRAPMPTWLRVVTVLAGVCGILAPLYFTYFLFALWTVGFGAWALRERRSVAPESAVQASLV